MDTINIKQQFSEPRNHQGTGKIERIIRLIQQIFAALNIESGGKLTNKYDDNKIWRIICSLLPFIQFSINQRCPRFTKTSPNMLMFGERLNDIEDINLTIENMIEGEDEDNINNKYNKLSNNDKYYVERLVNKLNVLRTLYKADYDKYSLITKETYNKRFNIEKKLKHNLQQFQPGKQVLYYVGDVPTTTKKWRQHWSGPWRIMKRFNDRTVEIFDPSDGAKQTVTMDRLKLYLENEYMTLYNQ